MAAQALARVTLEEDELSNASGLRAALLKTSDCVVETDTPIYSVVHVAVTPHRTIRLVAHGTCDKGLVLELRNPSYPPLLLAKILAAADAASTAEAANGGGRAARVAAGVTAARAWLASNLFAPAWRELRRCAKLCEERGGGMRRADAVSGVATFVVAAAGHRTSFEARVPAEYPARPAVLTLKSTTLPQPLVDACHKRCTELARKLSVGEKLNAAEMQAEMQSPGASTRRKNEPRVSNTAKHFQSLRRDTKQLKQIADLRAEGSKTARQDLKSFARFASERDQRAEAETSSSAASPSAGTPRPSLLAAVEYLVEFATSLPGATCGVCGKAALGGKLPTRALCGCWFHHQCLKRRFEAPPFKIECEPCGRRVWHEAWPNPEKLEAAYYAKQHRTADADLCADLFLNPVVRRAE